ncbi:hypothetical protein HDV01_005825 [Terramyces sp. JEL0728]|nr:hypothetical protein HDV01_005825 [Terramyces sp. JEL0728]
MPSQITAVALWNYIAQEDNEISFRAGDTIDIVELCNQDWYEGSINGSTGLFPANHVKLVDHKNENEENEGSESGESEGNAWHVVTTEAGTVYYWNEQTGETSWEPPSKDGKKITTSEGAPKLDLANLPPAVSDHIEIVPPELIRREGQIAYKAKKDYGGVEPKKQHSWHNSWAVVCVGYLIFYKEEPAKLKKKQGDKPIIPVHVQMLDGVTLKKEAKDAGRKNLISVQSRSGAVMLLQPNTENEVNEWFTTISESTKEASTQAEYENVMSRLFLKSDSTNELREDKKKTPTRDNSKKSLTPLDDDDANKGKVKAKLNAFFKRVGDIKENVTKKEKDAPVPVESLESQGIYRLSGNASTVQKFRAQLNQDNYQDIFEPLQDVNVIAALLKLFFREVQIPVIPFTMYSQFIDSMKIDDYNNRLCTIKTLVQALPKVHYDVLEYLMRHLVKVSAQSEVNKMEPSNLAIVFGPSLIRPMESGESDMYANMMNMSFQNGLIEAMINQTEWLFDGNPN